MAISRALSEYDDFSRLVAHMVEGITRSFEVYGCSVLLFDDHEKKLVHVRSYGISDEYLRKGPIFVDEKYTSFLTGQPVFIADLQQDERVQYPEAAAREGVVSMLSVPIKIRSEVIGLIRIYNDEPWSLHDDDVSAFCVLAKHLGLVIENNGLRNFLEGVKMTLNSLPLRLLKGL